MLITYRSYWVKSITLLVYSKPYNYMWSAHTFQVLHTIVLPSL